MNSVITKSAGTCQRKTNLSTVERLSAKEEESSGLDDMLRTCRMDLEQMQNKNKSLAASVQVQEHQMRQCGGRGRGGEEWRRRSGKERGVEVRARGQGH